MLKELIRKEKGKGGHLDGSNLIMWVLKSTELSPSVGRKQRQRDEKDLRHCCQFEEGAGEEMQAASPSSEWPPVTANTEMWSETYSHKEVESANNLNKLGIRFLLGSSFPRQLKPWSEAYGTCTERSWAHSDFGSTELRACPRVLFEAAVFVLTCYSIPRKLTHESRELSYSEKVTAGLAAHCWQLDSFRYFSISIFSMFEWLLCDRYWAQAWQYNSRTWLYQWNLQPGPWTGQRWPMLLAKAESCDIQEASQATSPPKYLNA